ncbi:Asp-tRNA(Asn)/Glu-tRNA(Gln) amidotransferase subunit GatA, partial [Patescibacteria group bacterium]|nr:Asp-tRNA(Asn)/Glu-tRNA(Gln) amidotransferase subunit GatA [Patescibacteria group bacterium]
MPKTKGFTISDINQGLKEKEFSAQELIENYLKKIKSLDEKLGAFLEVSQNEAPQQAKAVDDSISQGKEISILAGIPAAIKDNILVKDIKCTAASKILENYRAPYDATCVKKLREKGVVILGKTNLDEFAMGSSTEHSAFKKTRNPQDLARVPGGSSGGSAAAVRAGECCFALGSDTGGSIRQPASFCGVVGLKPTYGAVSRFGLIAFASSLDQIGPITKNVRDAEIVFDAIKGRDPLDSTSVESKFSIFNFQFSNLRIGVPKEYFGEGIEPEVRKVVEETIKKVEKEGAKIEEISL